MRARRSLCLDTLWASLAFASAVFIMASAPSANHVLSWLTAGSELFVGVLFLARREAVVARSNTVVICLIGLSLASGLGLDNSWPASPPAQVILCLGLLLYGGALCSLGRSFAILPGCRGVKTGGLYRCVRHPIYASYLVLDLSLLLNCPCWRDFSIVLGSTVLLMWRARLEEEVLQTQPEYRSYARAVRYRFMPGVY